MRLKCIFEKENLSINSGVQSERSYEFILRFITRVGIDGKSSYQLWIDQGNDGSIDDFIAWQQQPSVAAAAVAIQSSTLASQKAQIAECAAECATTAATVADSARINLTGKVNNELIKVDKTMTLVDQTVNTIICNTVEISDVATVAAKQADQAAHTATVATELANSAASNATTAATSANTATSGANAAKNAANTAASSADTAAAVATTKAGLANTAAEAANTAAAKAKVKEQYSPSGSTWSDDYSEGDLYFRRSNDNGETWGSAISLNTAIVSRATETMIGGVKAGNRTAEQTQEVKIDPETSKLYVASVDISGKLDDTEQVRSSLEKANNAEPAITDKKTAFNKDFGAIADSVAEGNHNHDGAYLKDIPVATETNIGGVKIGKNLTVNDDGSLSVEYSWFCPDLESAPDENTLTYQRDAETIDFIIGAEARVYDHQQNEYVFYKLHDINTENKALWNIAGSGSDTDLREKITINLYSNQAQPDDNLNGVEIYIAINGETTTHTWNGTTITMSLSPKQECTVSTSEVEGYRTPAGQSFTTAIQNTRDIAFNYNCCIVSFDFTSNQQDTSDMDNATATVSYLAALSASISKTVTKANNTLLIPIGTTIEITYSEVAGYQPPASTDRTFITQNETITATWRAEKVSITLSIDDQGSLLGQIVNITNTATHDVLFTQEWQGEIIWAKIPHNVVYQITVDDKEGYSTPTPQSYTANSAQRNVSFEYENIPEASIIFDKSISDPSNITGDVNEGLLATILSKFRRCLCKKSANGKVTIAYLKDSDSTKYEDGTTAVLTGEEGDVMVNFPEFYYKHEKIDANKFRYRFAEYNIDGAFKHVPRSLVGAYKAFSTANKLYSRSGVIPTMDTSFTESTEAAQARGAGYQLIDFQQHCVIAFMLYARYGNRNLQALLGGGGARDPYAITTGTTNSIGVADTVLENTRGKYVNGLGLEGLFGGLSEWVKGVLINDNVWAITDPDGTTRNVTTHDNSGWIKNIAAENGAYFDVATTAVGSSETTHYSDYFYQVSGGSVYLVRSGESLGTVSGVAYSDVADDAAYSYICARLAFRGVITETVSVEAFKELPLL